ncbi:MAG: hypothetical protein IPH86_19605 [bacterium]|nr:hypothetical protein [bacterium]
MRVSSSRWPPRPAGDTPIGYYDAKSTPDDLSHALRATLHPSIQTSRVKIPTLSPPLYLDRHTWNVLELADQDPLDQRTHHRQSPRTPRTSSTVAGNAEYDREHTWPRSFGFPNDGSSVLPPLHRRTANLFLCKSSYNSSRRCWRLLHLHGHHAVIAGRLRHGESRHQLPPEHHPRALGDLDWPPRRQLPAAPAFYFDGVTLRGDGTEPDLIPTDDINLIVAPRTRA